MRQHGQSRHCVVVVVVVVVIIRGLAPARKLGLPVVGLSKYFYCWLKIDDVSICKGIHSVQIFDPTAPKMQVLFFWELRIINDLTCAAEDVWMAELSTGLRETSQCQEKAPNVKSLISSWRHYVNWGLLWALRSLVDISTGCRVGVLSLARWSASRSVRPSAKFLWPDYFWPIFYKILNIFDH